MSTRSVVCLLIVLAFAGCNQDGLIEMVTPKEEAEFAKGYIALFQSRDYAAIEAKLDPGLKNPELRSKLEQIAAFFPAEKPTSIQTVGVESTSNAELSQVSLTFQYGFPGKWLLANVVLHKKAGNTIVVGVNVDPLPDSLQNITRFSFEGKGLTHLAVFIFAVLVPLFILAALVLCIRTPIPKQKWLWVLFILAGYAKVTLNWSDGNLMFSPISLQLLGAGFHRAGPFAPLMLSVSVPAGAIVFLLKRRKWMAQAKEAPAHEPA